MKRFFPVAVLALIAGTTVSALTPEELSTRSDTLVTGTVEESRAILHRTPQTAFYYVRLKVKVESIEKGREQIRGANIIEVRCWHNALGNADGPVGHRPIPSDGSRFRVWMNRHKEGYFEALEPNGFELLDGSADRIFPRVERRTSGMGQIIAGFVGLLAVCAAAFFRYRGRGPRDRSWSEPTDPGAGKDGGS